MVEKTRAAELDERILSLQAQLKAQQIRAEVLEKANLKLQQQIERDSVYARLIDTVKAILFSIDAQHTITHISPNIENYSKRKPSQLIGESFFSLVHPDDVQRIHQLCRTAAQDSGRTVEIRICGHGKRFHWMWANLVPMVHAQEAQGFKGLLIDIHQRKLAEINLSQSEEKYRKIIENIHEGYFECDLEGRMTFLNRALLEISGYAREQLIGHSFRDVCTPRAARAMQAAFGRVYRTGQDAKVTNYEVYHRDGHTLIVEFAATLMIDHQGQPRGFRGVVRDVSDMVKASAKEKRRQNQLQQIQKMEALGTLAGGLAHGFNNVLMAIQGNLSLMRMNLPANDPKQKHLERINQSTEKGGRLAREILSFAKIGKYVVMPTDLNKILKSTSRMFVRSNTNLRMHEIYDADLSPTRVDRVQIGQVLLSLYMHAAEAMPEGGDLYLQSENVRLDNSYTQPHGNEAGQYVKLTVTDSGIGLDEEAKRRVFEPFFTPYQPLRFEGMGLAAAYGTIKSHNGIINIYSEKGHGTTFTIYLPAIQEEVPAEPDEIKTNRGSETILVVDDDDIAAGAGREILERNGYRVMVANNGTEAMEVYTGYKDQIDLVLLDMILPDISGDQVYYEMVKVNPGVAVVLASGYNVNRQISALLNQGCLDFVQKPFQTQALTTKVRHALNRRAMSPGAVKTMPD